MATIKSFTDISQSKKLAEFLPLESADMQYISFRHKDDTIEWTPRLGTPSKYDIPCWSLAALIAFLKNQDSCMSIRISNKEVTAFYYKYMSWKEITIKEEEAVDACVGLIIKLKKNGII